MRNLTIPSLIMRGILAASILLAVLFSQTSCETTEQSVAADFFTTTSEVVQGTTITFIDQSKGNPQVYKWEFTGGTPAISAEKNPRVTYATPGLYEVRLTVSNSTSEDIEIKTSYIKVKSRQTETVYTVTVNTGSRDNAGTNARVYAQLIGTNGQTAEVHLDNKGSNDFERGSEKQYQITAPRDLGEIEKVNIRHDNSGNKAGWFLERVTVKNASTSQVWPFPCSRWLATSADDGKVSRVMFVNDGCS